MLRIGIVDDDKEFLEDFRQELEEEAKKAQVKIQVGGYLSGKSLMEEWKEEGELDFDLLFLDIDMPDLLGTDLGREIREEEDL